MMSAIAIQKIAIEIQTALVARAGQGDRGETRLHLG